MPARLQAVFDPLVRLLLVAIALATFVPVTGAEREIAQTVANSAVFLLFLLNGLRLPRHEVIEGIGNWRFLAPLVFWCFGAMALAGWGISIVVEQMELPAIIALGFLYLGTLPSTVQSATAYSSIAGGNVASSVVAAALLNILGVFVTAPLFSAMAGSASVDLGYDGLIKVATILLLPFILGQIGQRWLGEWVRSHKPLVSWMDRISIAIAVYVAFSGAVEQGIWEMVDTLDLLLLSSAVLFFLAFAFGGGWLLGGLIGLKRPNRISMLFAGGQKSIAMGAPLATVLFAPEVAGIVLLPVLVYHMLQLVISAPMANALAREG
jgi:sodium/bile acid cotransporter 7